MVSAAVNFHFMKITAPRSAYLIGPRELIEQARRLPHLPEGRPGILSFQLPLGIRQVDIKAIRVGSGEVFELEEAVALEMIRESGEELGEEGIPLHGIDGA